MNAEASLKTDTEPPSSGSDIPADAEPPSSTSSASADSEPTPSSTATDAAPTALAEPDAAKAGRTIILPVRGRRDTIRESARSIAFRKRFYPGVSHAQWSDWRWQVGRRIRDSRSLAALLGLRGDEAAGLDRAASRLPLSVTPYYASLLRADAPTDEVGAKRASRGLPDDAGRSAAPADRYASLLRVGGPGDGEKGPGRASPDAAAGRSASPGARLSDAEALRRTVIPDERELLRSPGEADDPLDEDRDSPTPGLVHRYPDRALFLTTNFCSVYCRYCTRSRLVGHARGLAPSRRRWQQAIDYIRETPSIRDVVLSGGDPLTLPDDALDWLLGELRSIPHLEIVRIGTKVPAVLPQRVTRSLCRILKKRHPLYMSLHFAHPAELTPETVQACERLADAGIPLGSQTVLLGGVNDDAATMTSLCQGLVRARVRPYYLYQCDPVPGSAHFRTPVARGLEMIEALRGHTSGYCVPHYVIDAPGGGGKIPLLPDYAQGYEGSDLVLRNYAGRLYRYPDPAFFASLPKEGAC